MASRVGLLPEAMGSGQPQCKAKSGKKMPQPQKMPQPPANPPPRRLLKEGRPRALSVKRERSRSPSPRSPVAEEDSEVEKQKEELMTVNAKVHVWLDALLSHPMLEENHVRHVLGRAETCMEMRRWGSWKSRGPLS